MVALLANGRDEIKAFGQNRLERKVTCQAKKGRSFLERPFFETVFSLEQFVSKTNYTQGAASRKWPSVFNTVFDVWLSALRCLTLLIITQC